MGLSTPAGAANSIGNQQSTAVTGQTVTPQQQTALNATYNANPANPAYWENQGFQSTQDFGTGNQTTLAGYNIGGGQATAGGAVYTNPKTGEVVFVDAAGQVQQRFTKEQWAAEQAKNQNGVTSAGEINQGAQDIMNGIPTPGISDSTKQSINQSIANGVTGQGGGPGDTSPGGNSPGSASGVGSLNLPSLTGSQSAGDIAAPIQAAIARQSAISDQMGQERANYQAIGAPNISQPGAIQAAMAGQQDPIQAAIAQAQNAQAAQVGQTALTPQQQAIQAQQVAAGQIAPTQVGQTTMANAAALDPTQQAQMRAAQTGLVGGLQDAIAGKDPSVAAIMLRNATDRNVANQYAMAQAANGMNTGFAQRTAMINAADANQQAIMQQALLRAQEITSARGQLGSVLDSARGQDIGLASQQAGLQQQANLANAGAQNTSTLTQAQINATQAQQQAQLGQAAAIANQQAGLQAGTTNATLAQQAAMANAASQNQTYQQNAAMQQAAGLQNAQLGTQTSLANANNQTQANTTSAQLSNAVNLANANNQSQANTATGQLQTQAAIANANNAVSTNALNQKATQDLAGNQLTASGQAGQTAVGGGNVQAELAKAEAAKQAALLGGVATAGAALLSDRREKTGITKAEAEIAEFTSKLNPYSFRYKAPGKPGAAPGKRFGIMAQDLERSAVGRSLVREDEDGTKSIDVPQSIGAILATLSAMNKRIEAR